MQKLTYSLGMGNALGKVLIKEGLGIGLVAGGRGIQRGQKYMQRRCFFTHFKCVATLVAALIVVLLHGGHNEIQWLGRLAFLLCYIPQHCIVLSILIPADAGHA